MHTSVRVQGLPSLHAVPFALTGFVHAPDVGSQTPVSWHWSPAHTTGLVPMQAPPMQTSARVQALPSLHAVPSAFGEITQVPEVGSHVPALLHWSPGQVTGLPVHAPATQVSPCVQGLPSLHDVPSGFGALLQAPVVGSQLPPVLH